MAIEGVDYSSTANADWHGLAQALKAAGKHFVGRYAVNDKSPVGRGIGAAEYAAMKAEGIDVFLYWESSEGWMTNGWQAGVNAAQNAQWNIENAGIPHDAVVYFACDFDAAPGHQGAIDDCLRGAASVLGANRVGLYAGYHVLLRAKQNGSAKWFCQTSAWSGGQVMEGTHLYQYSYNKYVYGTNCDWVQAYTENYGQAEPPFTPATEPEPPKPVEPPKKKFPKPRPVPQKVLDGYDYVDAKGVQWNAYNRIVHVNPGTKFYTRGSINAAESREPAGENGMDVRIAGGFNSWYVTPIGSTFKVNDTDVKVTVRKQKR